MAKRNCSHFLPQVLRWLIYFGTNVLHKFCFFFVTQLTKTNQLTNISTTDEGRQSELNQLLIRIRRHFFLKRIHTFYNLCWSYGGLDDEGDGRKIIHGYRDELVWRLEDHHRQLLS